MNNNSLLLLCLLLIGSAYCEYASACDSEISHPIMVEVPLNADPRQTALIVANAVLDDVNNLHPHETRCNVAIFAFTVTLKRGFFITTLPPTLTGEITQSEDWEDILPGMIWQRLGLDPDDAESDMDESGSTSCGNDCTRSSFTDFGNDGVEYEATVTYRVTFSCSGSACTLTYTILNVTVTRVSDGSPYFGTALVQNPSQEPPGPY